MQKLYFNISLAAVILVLMGLVNGCASSRKPLPMPERVELQQFMGRWYVLGYTPILVDKKAHNAIEHYRLDVDEKIRTTYQFREGGVDGDLKTYTPVGWVHDKESNAEWRMQFLWPFRSEYVIIHVDAAYTETIIGHPSRKYAWIMLREPQISEADYQRLLGKLEAAGYDRSVVQRLPQDWSGEGKRLEQLESEGL